MFSQYTQNTPNCYLMWTEIGRISQINDAIDLSSTPYISWCINCRVILDRAVPIPFWTWINSTPNMDE